MEDLQQIINQAEAGNPNARWWLVVRFISKSSSLYEPRRAERWLRLLSEQGYPKAQLFLARLLLQKQVRTEEALDWLRKSAEQGWLDAMLLLSDQRFIKANETLFWLERAAMLGDAQAQYRYGNHLLMNNETALALSFLNRSAEQNYLPAIDRLLKHYQFSNRASEEHVWSLLDGLLQDGSQDALKIFLIRCSDQYRAKYRRVVMTLMGQGLDELEAVSTVGGLVASDANTEINARIAVLLSAQDYLKAESLMREKSNVLSAKHLYRLGYLYRSGVAGSVDWGLAHEYYYRAAARGYPAAFNGLGVLYEKTKIMSGNRDSYMVAAAFYQEAVRRGDRRAARNLKDLQ